jgi:hypothetical protein
MHEDFGGVYSNVLVICPCVPGLSMSLISFSSHFTLYARIYPVTHCGDQAGLRFPSRGLHTLLREPSWDDQRKFLSIDFFTHCNRYRSG